MDNQHRDGGAVMMMWKFQHSIFKTQFLTAILSLWITYGIIWPAESIQSVVKHEFE